MVYAKTDPAAGPRGITTFIVETDRKGFKVARSSTRWACAAPRPASWSSRICEIPEENVLGAVGKGVNVLMSGLDYERAVLAGADRHHAGGDGHRSCPMSTSASSSARRSASSSWSRASSPTMYTTMNACKAYVYAVAKACDRGQTTRKDSAGAILYAAEKATMVALDAIQLLGGNGYINDYPTGRLLRDASSTRSAPAPAKSAAC